MSTFLAVVGFLGFIIFIVMALISGVKKTGKGKKRIIYAAVCFVLMIIGAAVSPDAKETAGSKVDENKQESSATQKVTDADKKKAEVQKKADAEAAAKKKVEEEAAAKKKAEEAAKLKEQQETPQYKLEKAVTKALGKKSNREGNKITTLTLDENGAIILNFKGDENLTENLTVSGIQKDISDSIQEIQKSKLPFKTINIITTYSMVDKFGNAKEDEVINLTYNKETVDKINFENFDRKNLYSIADLVQFVHPQFVVKK